TEAVTGIDLVAEQIAVASGAGLRLKQQDVRVQGCALECRVNAEDPGRDFQPAPGLVDAVSWPAGPGIRVDTHIASGSRVPPYYDSLLRKIIVHGPDRAATVARMREAIAGTRVSGVATNLAFHSLVLAEPEFQAGGVDTGFVARLLERSPIASEGRAHG